MVYAKPKAAAAISPPPSQKDSWKRNTWPCVRGRPPEEGKLRDLLFRDRAKNKSYVVDRMRKGVREAVLRYETLARREGLSLVRIRLETGRSHQIRVQFASRGFPLLGDKKYGSRFAGPPPPPPPPPAHTDRSYDDRPSLVRSRGTSAFLPRHPSIRETNSLFRPTA